MEKEKAVGKMLTSLRIGNEIPESLKEHLEILIPYLRTPFEQMYQIGYDAKHKKPSFFTPIERIDSEGNVLEHFETMVQAAAAHKINRMGIWRSAQSGKPSMRGQYWRYAKSKPKE